MNDGFDPRDFRVVTGLDGNGDATVEVLCERDTQTDMVPPFAVTLLSEPIDAARARGTERHRTKIPVPDVGTCGSRCPVRSHDHGCARSPGHLSACRDVKQKGDETCAWDVPHGDQYGR